MISKRMLSVNATSASASASVAVGNKPMYQHQSKLPKLPVQDLHKGLEMYLKSIQPLVTVEEFKQTQAYVQDFAKPGGLGETLHQRLLEKAKVEPRSWLINWWNDWAYMSYRYEIGLFCFCVTLPAAVTRSSST